MNPFSSNSYSVVFNSRSSAGAMRYEAMDIGVVLVCSSILKSTSRVGGNPGNSIGNTSA